MWKKIGNFIIIIILAQGIEVAALHAAEPEISISINKHNVLLGDSIILTITMQNVNNPAAPELPAIPNFDMKFQGTRQESFSSFTMIVQGRTVQQKQTGGGLNFDYELIPQKAGIFDIPSLALNIGGKIYRTDPFQIQVYDQSEKSEDIFLKVHADKKEAYLGEKILLTVKWYLRRDIEGYRLNVPWLEGLKNFLIADPELDQNGHYQRLTVNGNTEVIATQERTFYKGQQYTVISFQKILTPISVGTYTLDPIFLKCNVVSGYQQSRRRGIFDDFFDSTIDSFFSFSPGRTAVTQPFSTRSEPIPLTVLEVPNTQKPVSFSGAVGDFDFLVEVKPLRVKAGDPITVTMKVSGSGNIEQVKLPPFPQIDGFKSYEPESRFNPAQNNKISGEKIFEIVLVPKKKGNLEIPPIAFTYFDPHKKNYATITRGPFTISVDPGAPENETVQVMVAQTEGELKPRQKEIQVVERDIQYIKTEIGPQASSPNHFYDYPLIWILVYLPPMFIFAGLFIWNQQRERFRTDIGYARQKMASHKVKSYLEQASRALGTGDSRNFYDALSKGINQYLADKLNRPIAGIEIQSLLPELTARGLDADSSVTLKHLQETCDLALFSPVKFDSAKLKEELNTAKNLINRLEKLLR